MRYTHHFKWIIFQPKEVDRFGWIFVFDHSANQTTILIRNKMFKDVWGEYKEFKLPTHLRIGEDYGN